MSGVGHDGPGRLLGRRYRLLRTLGRGGMGEVHLAHQLNLGRLVVIKLVGPAQAALTNVRALLDEARVAARLHHPNVVSVLDVSGDGEPPFVVLEYLAGVSLREVIDRLAPEVVPTSIALTVAVDLLRGLHHAHGVRHPGGVGVVHRDVKPRNVMVTFAGVSKLIDFGISHWLGDDAPEPAMAGTRGYMAPEQYERAVVDGAADQYAVGVTLHELLTGVRPRGDDVTTADTPAAAARLEPRADLDDELAGLIGRATAGDPTARWPSCGDFADELEALARRRGLVLAPSRVERWLGERFAAERDASTLETASTVGADDVEATRVSGDTPAPTNLEHPGDRFFGRADELAELSHRFGTGARVVTVLGPPGMGKTRLAREHAWATREGLAGGAWFVDLTEARSVDGVVIGIAVALGIGNFDATVEGMIRQLGAAIAHRGRVLMVLDNFEQVVAHAAVVERLAQLAPASRWLVTSRERLGLPGEVVLELGPLGRLDDTGSMSGVTPTSPGALGDDRSERWADGGGTGTDDDELVGLGLVDDDDPGLALLLDRAERAPGGSAGPGDPEARARERLDLRAIVRRLEGNPLALELAASRLRVLSPGQLRARLGAGLDVLTSRRRGVPDRQTGFDKAIAWSWQLLEPWEQGALAQAAVFRGGFSLDAAEVVLDLSTWADAPPVLDVLASLCDKSLLRRGATGELPDEPRFRMFEGVRAYARARLQPAEAASATLARHARFVLDLAERWARCDELPAVRERAAHLAAERENIWALVEPGLDAGAGPGEVALAVRAVAALVPIYEGRGLRAIVRRALDHLLELPASAGAPPAALAICWRERARVHPRGELARSFLDRSLALARGHDLHEALAWATLRLLPMIADAGDLAAYHVLLDDSRRRCADQPDWRAVCSALALSYRMVVPLPPELQTALVAELPTTAATTRRPAVAAQIHWALAVNAIFDGELASARDHFARVVDAYEDSHDDQASLALARGNIAAINLALDRDLDQARAMAERSRRALLDMGLIEGVPFNEFNLALICEGMGDHVGAEAAARRCLDWQGQLGTGGNWMMRGDTGRVAAAAQLAISLTWQGRVDEATATLAMTTTWTVEWTAQPPSSANIVAAALALLDAGRAHLALAADGDPDTAEACLHAARARTEAAWSDEVPVVLRRLERRIAEHRARSGPV
ncbi:MAG: protein kinase [Kofleriaceae bacterium]|nr:protein kinase [Kofleriaceae bacterium]